MPNNLECPSYTEITNDSSSESHEVLAMLLGTLASRQRNGKLVIPSAELDLFTAVVETLTIQNDPETGDFTVSVTLPAEG